MTNANELVAVKLKDLESAAQQIHQGYHGDQPYTWLECPRNVCSLFRHIIENAEPVAEIVFDEQEEEEE